MNPLQSRLNALRRRWHFVTLMRGISLLGIVLLGSLLVAGGLDWWVHLPSVIRAVLLVGILGGAGVVFYRFLVVPFLGKTDDLALALKVEEQYPSLNDSLASTVQFLNQGDDAPGAGSASMRKEAIQRALRLAQGCDFNKVINTRGLGTASVLASLVAIAATAVTLWFPSIVYPAVLRLAHPFGEHPWATDTRIDPHFKDRIATGEAFEIKGFVTGVIPPHAIITFNGLSSSEVPREYPIKLNDAGTKGTFVAKLDMSTQFHDFRFSIRANDARSPYREGRWHTVKVAQPPNLIELAQGVPSPRMTLFPPAYTGKPDREPLPPGARQVEEAYAGTEILLEAATDRVITQAWIQYAPADPNEQKAAQLGLLGQTNPWSALTVHDGTKEGFKRVPAQITGGGQRFSVRFRPWISGNYILHIEDEEGLPNEYSLMMNIVPDPRPIVNLKKPSANMSLLADATISLNVTAEDELFGLRNIYIEYWRKDQSGRILSEPQRLPLFSPTMDRAMLAPLLPNPENMPPLGHRPTFMELQRRWSINGLAKVGEILVIQACADDHNDVAAYNIPGRSHRIELRIVDRPKLDEDFDKKQAKAYKELLRLRKWQNDAIKKVIEAEQQLKNTDKLREDDVRKLMEAKELQKRIQEQIGETSKEGLRKDLNELQQAIKDNGLHSSAAKARVDTMKRELERLAKEHLPQIEPRLGKALQNADQQANQNKNDTKNPKNNPLKKAKDELSKARQHQKEVQQSLDDLLKHLDRWATVQEIKGETSSLLKEQKDLKNETEKLAKDQKDKQGTPEWKATLDRIRELQRHLGERTDRLIDKLDRVAEEKRTTDPKMAERVGKAAQVGKDLKLSGAIRDTDQQLKKNRINRAVDNQKEGIKALNKMMDALKENRTDELERLVKKQKKAQEDLKKIGERLEKLRKKTKQAQDLADAKQREQALQDLAKEQEQLAKDAREKARELATDLQAGAAARQMRKAAEEMEKALKRLEEGKNPEEQQQEAKERLDQAKQELEQAERAAKEALERERLAKIADHLEGLRDRQQAALDETDRINSKVMSGGWAQFGLRASMAGQIEVQSGLVGETGKLAEKLKNAKVFEMILKKAERDMKRAVAAIQKRWDDSNKRRFEDDFEFNAANKKEEKQNYARIVKHQTRAHGRLKRLLETLKEELRKPPQAGQKQDKKDGDGKKGNDRKKKPQQKEQNGIQAQDGISAMAQLKALRSEQADVNTRTDEFHQIQAKNQNLTLEQITEIQELHEDQEAILLLFQELMTALNQKGAQP